MSATPHAPPKVDPSKLVFWVDVLLLGVLGLATLVSLPRRVERFVGRTGEWKQGHILCMSFAAWSSPCILTNMSDHTRTDEQQASSASSSNSTVFERRPDHAKRFSHIPSGRTFSGLPSTFTSKLVYFFRTPLFPNYSIGRVILMLLYFGVLLFAALYRDSVFTNPVRDAWVAVSQLPFVYALAGKNNVFTILLGIGYEKVCLGPSSNTG